MNIIQAEIYSLYYLCHLLNKDHLPSLKILVAGNYSPDNNRLHVLLKGLAAVGVRFIEFPLKQNSPGNKKKLRNLDKEIDLIYMPPYSHNQVAFVRKHTTKPLIFDPYVSQFYNQIIESSYIGSFLSPKSIMSLFIDKRSFGNADLILGTSESHAHKFKKLAGNKTPVAVLPVGYVADKYFPLPNNNNESNAVRIGYTGKLNRRYGLDVIIKAAQLLQKKNIIFELIGSGADYEKLKLKLKKHAQPNIQLTHWVKLGDLNAKINEFELCLGDFGSSARTDHVMPEDIYRYAACQKPIISRQSPGTAEIFEDNKEIFFTRPNAHAIAAKIEELLPDKKAYNKVAENARQKVKGNYTEKHIAQIFLDIVAANFPHLKEKVNHAH